MELLAMTTRLLVVCDEATVRFYDMRERQAEPDFFNEVKPYADEIRALLETWQQLAYEWIAANQPKYMHKQQIDHARDAMEQFVVQSFYKATSKKRLIQSIESTKYTLGTLKRYVEEGSPHV
ncbi:YppE family protein [Lysinibacillus odysseyi]|uniref:Endonuclease III n=1 Tax=Lysinibacillus odysseyi 34hs-1 = NBRC 100172 TaxID=1220589 RepID=A0A0A3IA70_9BACI|nr:YppE family protein [Lysinibacillus odysseyi]KGR81666.1 hypothetical protein CD32_20175 [Lysinibacillus odysseyi 34hs-1 = NBRC 100172]